MIKAISLTMTALMAYGAAQAGTDRIEVQGRAPHRLSALEANDMAGSYAMADGRLLNVAKRGLRLSAELDGMPSRRLVALSPTRLQSDDGLITLDFDTAANGSVRGVTLTIEGRTAVASVR